MKDSRLYLNICIDPSLVSLMDTHALTFIIVGVSSKGPTDSFFHLDGSNAEERLEEMLDLYGFDADEFSSVPTYMAELFNNMFGYQAYFLRVDPDKMPHGNLETAETYMLSHALDVAVRTNFEYASDIRYFAPSGVIAA